jgi:hypothetical protein
MREKTKLKTNTSTKMAKGSFLPLMDITKKMAKAIQAKQLRIGIITL